MWSFCERMNSSSSSTLNGTVCLLSPVSSLPSPIASVGYIPREQRTSGAYFFANAKTSLFVGTFTPAQIMALTPAFLALSSTASKSSLNNSCVRWQWSSNSIMLLFHLLWFI